MVSPVERCRCIGTALLPAPALRFVAVLVCCAIIPGCAVNPVSGQRELMLVSESQEIEMGRQFYPSALWGDLGGGGEFKDEALKGYLKDIVLNIHRISQRPHLPVDFTIQNSSIPNAWAIPGYVTITRGLLAGLDNEAEFVFVMGHEMGHVSARHSASQMSYSMLQQIGLGAAGIVAGGTAVGDLALGVGAVGSSLLLLKYGRDDELEADRLGISYMTRLGYDPKYAITAHQNLERAADDYLKSVGKSPRERTFFDDLMSTHPRTSVRIDEIELMIRNSPPFIIAGDGSGEKKFRDMTGRFRKTNSVYTQYYDKAVTAYQNDRIGEAEPLVDKAVSADRNQAPFHALEGFISLKKKDYRGADRHFETALLADDGYAPAYRGIGTGKYLQEKYEEGIPFLKRSIAIHPKDPASHYYLGMSYYRTKKYDTAIPHLQVFEEVQPKHPEIHGVLGICYEQSGEVSSAYNEYSLQIKVAPDNEMGKHAASRLPVLRPAVEKKRPAR